MKVIALYSPYPGCGKTTAAHAIQRKFPEFVEVTFADPIRAMCVAFWESVMGDSDTAYSLTHSPFNKNRYLTLNDDVSVSSRQLMQLIGTDMARNMIHPDFWIAVLDKRLQRLMHTDRACNVIVSDLRFENEYRLLDEKYGAYFIRVERPTLDPPAITHASDGRLNAYKFDAVLWNNGSKEHLRRCAEIAANHAMNNDTRNNENARTGYNDSQPA